MAYQPPTPARNCSYSDFFANPANDPFQNNYTRILAPYHIPLAGNDFLTPVQVQRLVLDCQQTNSRIPTAFLLLHPDGLLHCYVQVDSFAPRAGLPPTPWDNQLFAQKGELLPDNSMTIIQWPGQSFHLLQRQIRVGSIATIDESILAAPNENMLGPYNDNDDGTELVRVRRTCYVPPSFVPAFLATNMTPKLAWTTVVQSIRDNNQEVACKPLIDFIRVAITRSEVEGESALSIAVPTVPLVDGDLYRARRSILERDFPVLNQRIVQGQQADIAHQLHLMTQENRERHEAEAARKAAAKEVSLESKVGGTKVIMMMRLCNATTEDQLPSEWVNIVKAPKKNQLDELQFAINDWKEDTQDPDIEFPARTSLLETIRLVNLHMADTNAIDTGLSPFTLSQPKGRVDRDHLSTYSALYGGGSAPSTADANALHRAVAIAPTAHHEAISMIRRLQIMCRLFGENNQDPYNQLGAFCSKYRSMEGQLDQIEMDQAKELLPTMIVRYVTLQCSRYFRDKAKFPRNIEFPVLDLFDKLEVGDNWEQKIPSAVLTKLGLTNYVRTPRNPIAPRLPPSQQSEGRPAPPGGSALPDSARGERILNPTFDSMFSPFKEMNVSCKSLRDKINTGLLPDLPVSKKYDGPMCLAYHTKGLCMTNCRCNQDHVSYSAEEYSTLKTWCDNNFRIA